jgi:uncharacterized protein (TIGR02145 family)
MKKIFLLVFYFTIFIIPKISQAQINVGSFTDQSGNSYKTVKIGNQIWMAENLRTTRYSNGENIEFGKASWYIDDPMYISLTNGQYLYSWEAIKDGRGIAPQGWHVPSKSEWEVLYSYCRSNADLKSKTGWPIAEYGGYYKTVTCPNCSNWNSEYRRKVACHVCKDNRTIQGSYVNKTTEATNGNDRFGFNIKNLGIYEEGKYVNSNVFWTSELDTNPQHCGSVCGNAFMFDVSFFYVTYRKHHENLLPVRLIKD